MTGDAVSPDTILIDRSPGETRYALLAGDGVIEVAHRRDGTVQPGAVSLGRVTAKVPGVKAVFVDIGAALPGVLAVKTIPAEGTAFAVRVAVPPRGGKGAELKRADTAVPADARAPALLSAAPEPAETWLEKYPDSIRRVICAPLAETTRVKALLKGADVEDHIEDHKGRAPLFTHYGVEDAIEEALVPDVPLPGGGRMTIEATAAVIAVDIDSGGGDPATANREAMAALARQLRLRNLAGHGVVDIIPVGAKAALARTLAKAMKGDPARTHVAGLTPLGMIEFTRQRLGLSLAETLCGPGGGVSAETAALAALRAVLREASGGRSRIALEAHPDVIAALNGPLRGALAEAAGAAKAEIGPVPRPDFRRGQTAVAAG